MIDRLILKKGHFGEPNEDRLKISMMTSVAGLLSNITLSALKIGLFLITNSVGIFADAINNLTDCLSSLITLFGAKLSSMPADDEHPYGHGRIEYISSLVVSIFVIVAGVEFLKASVGRILNPVPVEYGLLPLCVMIVSAGVKLYMGYCYGRVADRINSLPIKAQSKDSLSDVFVTMVVVVSIIIFYFTGKMIDGYVGLIVSLVILKAGYDLISETFSEIIGTVSSASIEEVENIVNKQDRVLGVHDVVITTFGPNKTFISLDVELDANMGLVEAHMIVDKIEREIAKSLDAMVSIHIDPVGKYCNEEELLITMIEDLIKEDKRIISYHDISYEEGLFRGDLVVDGRIVKTNAEINNLKEEVSNRFKEKFDCNYELAIDRQFGEVLWRF